MLRVIEKGIHGNNTALKFHLEGFFFDAYYSKEKLRAQCLPTPCEQHADH